MLGVDTTVFVNRPRHLHDHLARAATTFGDRPYLVFPDSTVTYAQAAATAGQLARLLASEYGVGKGDRVLIHAENAPEGVLVWLACATLGAVGVTTNTKSVGSEIAYFAEHTAAVAAVTQPQFAAVV
nr:AMP-binding protein [Micromonospora sp. DSM 115978]